MGSTMLDKLVLEDVPERIKEVAEVIGIEAFKKLVLYAGGTTIYVPIRECVTRNTRNRILKNTFKGDYKSVAKQYRLS